MAIAPPSSSRLMPARSSRSWPSRTRSALRARPSRLEAPGRRGLIARPATSAKELRLGGHQTRSRTRSRPRHGLGRREAAFNRPIASACFASKSLIRSGGTSGAKSLGRLSSSAPANGYFGAGEEAVEGVIVARGDRVVLVVVAAGASQREAEHDLAGRVQRVLDDLVDILELPRAEPLGLGDEPGRDHPAGVVVGRPVGGQDVAGELLVEEPVIGDVGVECVDDVVAVEVRLGDRVVGVIAGGIGIPGEVEPVASPALAVAGRGEQLVDQPRDRRRAARRPRTPRPARARAAGRSGRSTPGGSASGGRPA